MVPLCATVNAVDTGNRTITVSRPVLRVTHSLASNSIPLARQICVVIVLLFVLNPRQALALSWDSGDKFANPCLPHAHTPHVCAFPEMCGNPAPGVGWCQQCSPEPGTPPSILGSAGSASQLAADPPQDITVSMTGGMAAYGLHQIVVLSDWHTKRPTQVKVYNSDKSVLLGTGVYSDWSGTPNCGPEGKDGCNSGNGPSWLRVNLNVGADPYPIQTASLVFEIYSQSSTYIILSGFKIWGYTREQCKWAE